MNPWDKLSGYFDTHKDATEINPGAADNILIAWPSVIRGIKAVQNESQGLKALDYGCGGGGFAAELLKHGYEVVGCDSSSEMIAVAKKNLGEIPFYVCDFSDVKTLKEAPFDLVTGIMVFQFVDDMEECIRNLVEILKPGGVFAFAVFNPDYVRNNHGKGKLFDGFEGPQIPARGYMCVGEEIRIPVFMRAESEYDQLASSVGLSRVYTDKPPFTESFLQKYPSGTDTTEPEYLVMVYAKK